MTKILLSRVPPSANGLFATNRRTGARFKTRDYKNWLMFSQAEVMMQRPGRHVRRVDISIRLPESRFRKNSDGDNRAKACLDLLVKQGVIADDSRDYVRKTSVEFADIEQTEIIITDCIAEAA